MSTNDKTLLDNNRTDLSFLRSDIGNVLPDHFKTDYPNLIKLFEAYYEWMESADNPSGKIKRLNSSRDATQVPVDLLQYLEDELLLGQAYFGGFINKREAIKFSNTLYRSKGTKYSIEQFFRGFFGEDPQIIYPKDNVFKVGPAIDYDLSDVNGNGQQIKTQASVIGPESRKFITDDKLYQVLSVLIRIGIPLNEWVDTYKLFVHPAGVFLGAELLLELVNTDGLQIQQSEIIDEPDELLLVELEAELGVTADTSETLLLRDSDLGIVRITTEATVSNTSDIQIGNMDADRSVFDITGFAGTLMDDSGDTSELILTVDQDSAETAIFATMDMGKFSTVFDTVNSADSADYPL